MIWFCPMASEPHTYRSRSVARYRYRWHSAAFLASMFVIAMIALGAMLVSSRAASTPLLDDHTMSADRAMATRRTPSQVSLAGTGNLQLMLPVFEREVTAVGYHPVADEGVLVLTPRGSQANSSFISQGLGGVISGSEGPEYYVMSESQGPPFQGIDVGAPAGTFVYAPVDGTVAGIRSYSIAGRCADVELIIKPRSDSRLLVILTHMDRLEVTLGQPVRASETRLGAVRALDGCIDQDLSNYTYDHGNHLHMQVEAVR